MTAAEGFGPYADRPIPVDLLVGKRLERYWAKVVKTPGCWVWTGGTTGHRTHPYGRFRIGDGLYVAHRIAYVLEYGNDALAGLVIDHACGVTLCVNPAHMDAVTQAENLERGSRWAS